MQRFYGGDPERWLHMPYALIKSFIGAMKIIDAREKLEDVTVHALGLGSLTKHDAKRLMGKLKHLADDGATPVGKVDPKMLSSIGIGFETNKK